MNINLLEQKLIESLEEAFKKAFGAVDYPKIEIEEPRDFNLGDFSSNLALKACKVVKLSPEQCAKKIIENLVLPEGLSKVEFAAPGFINFHLNADYLINRIEALVNQQNLLNTESNHKKTVIVEYSQPNIAKPLGVHHLLSTIIGQCIYNTYKNLGYNTVGINYIGDWGTQFGKLIYAYKSWGNDEEISKDPINELLKLYVKFHEEAEKDDSLNDKGRAEFKKLEDGDVENRRLLDWIKIESLKDVQKTYDLLGGISFDLIQGEAYYEKLMEPIIQEGIQKGIFVEGEKGALVVNFADNKIPTCLVRKADGATLYFTRDLAVIKHRTENWQPEKIIYVVDIAQELHLRQVFETVKMLWGQSYLPELKHVEFGRMSFPEGKMSTRKGTVILLQDFLLEAIERAKQIVKEKNPELDSEAIENIAKIVGTGAVKYAVLSQNRTTNIVFTWDKMLSLEGNSAPYIQYAFSRANSILAKIEENIKGEYKLIEEQEIKIARLLAKFPRVIKQSAEEYKPNIIANYLYELTQSFHAFYVNCPVIKSSGNTKYTRMQILKSVCEVLKTGLSLLGIQVSERM